jgi:H2-forming N5,N10-methylenetetrahydromethanopterin dehydrogenase-like enzyme
VLNTWHAFSLILITHFGLEIFIYSFAAEEKGPMETLLNPTRTASPMEIYASLSSELETKAERK